jgi:hypothetical protein
MKLFLDYTQRINLHALIGAQRASVGELRLWWRLQDRIDLNDEERVAVNYRVGKINGIDQPMWEVFNGAPPRDYDFSEEEFGKISKIVNEWQPGYLVSGDRRWLQDLLSQLQPEKDHASTEAPVHAGYRA